jgi:hypothetical protein
MTELKTLKDLEFETEIIDNRENEEETDLDSMNICEVGELRQEAIKWIKSITEETYEDFMKIPQLKIYTALGKAWIMYFFNITEEDLR